MVKEINQDNWFKTSYRIDEHGDVHCYFHLGKVEHGMSLAYVKELRNNLTELIDAVTKEGITA